MVASPTFQSAMIPHCLFYAVLIEAAFSFPRKIDIGHAFNENTIFWVGKSPFTVTNKNSSAGSSMPQTPFYASNDFSISEHAGTHLDSPFHFNKMGWNVADIPLQNLLVEGILVDVRSEVQDNAEFTLQSYHLEEWEQMHGNITTTTVILINFGWASKWTNKTLYFGYSRYQCHFPKISKEAAEWIANNENIVGVGVDTASVDYGPNDDYKVHKVLSRANIFNLENVNLNNVDLPARGFSLIIMPMKLSEGVAAPCRIIAIIKEENVQNITISTVDMEETVNVTKIINNAPCHLKIDFNCLIMWCLITFSRIIGYNLLQYD
ncbi:kynurenine formamidase [Nilaparvata lugens]|uniref:kynurenine formamidase n=1 Tax=Nilaparvata lugens TaxID=108931 RepID=UPI00193CB005|nr:kynurenine formamidase [Nilaparvata lugens]